MAKPQPQGFMATPPAGKGRGVLVLHAWWGLNDSIKGFCTRLADSGFTAFAPDLYHGKVVNAIPEAEKMVDALWAKHEGAEAEVADAARYLGGIAAHDDHGLAVIGFSMGTYYAVKLSTTDPEHVRSVVLFYGAAPIDLSASKSAYLFHFAENDPYEPQAEIDEMEAALKRAGRPATFYQYKGAGHWFFEPDRTDAYNKEAASLAWDRTLAFLKASAQS